MKNSIIAISLTLLILTTGLCAMEDKPHHMNIIIANDTDYPLRINEDDKKLELEPHKEHIIDPNLVRTASLKYLKSYDLTATPLDISAIASRAQENDVRIHIVPGFYGVKVGEIEPIGKTTELKEKKSDEEKQAERVHYGLEESMLSVGTTPNEEEAYKLLGVHQGASGHEILGLSADITLANLGPDKYLKLLKDAYNAKNRHLFAIAPAPSPIVKHAYTEITAKAYHDLGGWAQEASKVNNK